MNYLNLNFKQRVYKCFVKIESGDKGSEHSTIITSVDHDHVLPL